MYSKTGTGMEAYFTRVKNPFGQSFYDNLLSKFMNASKSYLDSFRLSEQLIYGSARLGIFNQYLPLAYRYFNATASGNELNTQVDITINISTISYSLFAVERGNKSYELSNHLGNVLTVISDKRVITYLSDTVAYYSAEIISATDYSPFGAPLPGRTFSGEGYRYRFNGKENDSETYGDGNALDFGSRIYDARLGKFFSLDCDAHNYPANSPYDYAINCPIKLIDKDGKGPIDPRTWERKNSFIQLTFDHIIVYAVWSNQPTEFPVNPNKPNYRFDADLLASALAIGVYKEGPSQFNALYEGISNIFGDDNSPSKFVVPPTDRRGSSDKRGGATYQVGGYLALKDAAFAGNYDYNEKSGNTLTLTTVTDGVISKVEKYTNVTWSGDFMLQSTTTYDVEYYSEITKIQKDGKTFKVTTGFARVTETTTYANGTSEKSPAITHKISEETKEIAQEEN